MNTLDLTNNKPTLIKWLDKSLSQFDDELPQHAPTFIGIYSSPPYGWVSISVNCTDTDLVHTVNCPDFEFVEHGLIELGSWQDAYNSQVENILIAENQRMRIDPDKGDEDYIGPFFIFLRGIAKEYFPSKHRQPIWVGVQMLDSSLQEFWKL